MTDHRSDEELLSTALLESARTYGVARNNGMLSTPEMIDSLIVHRLNVDEQIRRVAFGTWAAIAILVIASSICYGLSRSDIENIAEAARPAMLGMIVLTVLTFVLSLIMTFAWLARTRGPSPHVLDARLAAIEQKLERVS